MQKANDLQDSVSKILHIDNKLEQDEMEGVEDKEWVRIFYNKNIIDLKKLYSFDRLNKQSMFQNLSQTNITY